MQYQTNHTRRCPNITQQSSVGSNLGPKSPKFGPNIHLQSKHHYLLDIFFSQNAQNQRNIAIKTAENDQKNDRPGTDSKEGGGGG